MCVIKPPFLFFISQIHFVHAIDADNAAGNEDDDDDEEDEEGEVKANRYECMCVCFFNISFLSLSSAYVRVFVFGVFAPFLTSLSCVLMES